MSVAEFIGFSASFMPFTIVVAAIAVSVILRDLRAPVMFAGIIISGLLYSSFMWAMMALLRRRVDAGGLAAGGAGQQLFDNLAALSNAGEGGCDTLIMPFISSGLIPRGNVFFLAWVTSYLAWAQSQWSNVKGAAPTNPYVWAGIALSWVLIGYTWNTPYGRGGETCGPIWPTGIVTALVGTVLGLSYGAMIGAISPTTLYFAPLSSDNIRCNTLRQQVFSCTIGDDAAPPPTS